MTVAYDLRYASDHFLGIATYAWGLLDALLRQPGEERFVVLWDPGAAHTRFDLDHFRGHPRVRWVERPWPPLQPLSLLRTGQWLQREKPAVYLTPFHFLPFQPGCPCVVTVHDLRPLRFPAELSWLRRRSYRSSVERVARARLVSTVSDFTRGELLSLVAVEESRVRTVHPGVQPGLDAIEPRRPAGAPDSGFALVVGDNRPHKNHAMLAQAWAQLGPAPPLALVAAGPVDRRHPSLADQVSTACGAPVHALGRVADAELVWLYRNAALLLLPSLYEGFGSPLAEALSFGVPVLAADIPALREVGRTAACFVPPASAEGWSAAIRSLAADAVERSRLATAGRARAGELSYDHTARATLALLHEAVA